MVLTFTLNLSSPSFIREPNESRQSNLKVHFHFECSCEACLKSYPIAFNTSLSNEVLKIEDGLIISTSTWREEFKKNCRDIEDNHRKFPSHALCQIMDRNLYLLAAIARNEPFVFWFSCSCDIIKALSAKFRFAAKTYFTGLSSWKVRENPNWSRLTTASNISSRAFLLNFKLLKVSSAYSTETFLINPLEGLPIHLSDNLKLYRIQVN